MSCSSSDEEDWVLYRNRPEWNDVVPLSQDDGPNPVVAIAYSDKFRDVYDYFRAVLKASEMTERSLKLTADAIRLNPANYTVWEFRRQILKHLNKDLTEELLFTEEAIDINPKNYQVWHHRLVIVQMLNDPKDEVTFVNRMLHQDAKNYHAWHYRQWLLRTFGLYEGEMDYVNQLLGEDLRNNSAWSQRYFVIQHTTGFTKEIIEKEIDYCVQSILKVKKNESAWNYLRGVVSHCEDNLVEAKAYGFAEELYRRGCRSPYLLSYLVDALALKLNSEKSQEIYDEAIRLCSELAEKRDIIRKKYWNYVAKNLTRKFDQWKTSNET